MQDKILNTAEIYHYLIDKLYYDQGSFYKKNSDGTLKSIGSLDPSGYMRMWIDRLMSPALLRHHRNAQ